MTGRAMKITDSPLYIILSKEATDLNELSITILCLSHRQH